MSIRVPDYAGGGLVNLMATVESRLVGSAAVPGLTHPSLSPEADGFVLLVLDGLGAAQLESPPARPLIRDLVGTLTAGFPTTTTTSLATIVTASPPASHGVIGHILCLPGVAEAVNVLKWVSPDGRPVHHDYASVLPYPNLWERLRQAGIEPITVQPGEFLGSPLSMMLYRGCRFEPVWSTAEMVAATADLARPGRLVMPYYPAVDVAAHVYGQSNGRYVTALSEAARIWDDLCARVPSDVGLMATADHGHIDYQTEGKLLLRDRSLAPLRFHGDPRATYVSGPSELVEEVAAGTGATVVAPPTIRQWLGPGTPHADLEGRLPDALLLAAPGTVLLPRTFDKRLIGYHGGLEEAEVEVPLLVR